MNSKQKKAIESSSANTKNIIPLIFLSAYFVVELITTDVIDTKGFQWLGFSVLNVCALLYIFLNRARLKISNNAYFKNIFLILIGAFFVLSGISIFSAINKPQSLIAFANIATVMNMVFIFYTLLYKRLYLLKNLAVIVSIIALIQTFSAMSHFFKNLMVEDLRDLIRGLKGNMSNQNIFAFSLVVKSPFLIYALLQKDHTFLKILSIIALWLSFLTIFFTQSRAAYTAIPIMVILLITGISYVFFTYKEKKKIYTNATILAGVYLSSLIVYHVINNSVRTQSPEKGIMANLTQKPIEEEARAKYWNHTLDFIKEKPITGYGIGNYELYIPRYYSKLTNGNKFSRHPHNEFLNIAAESGVLNALIYLSIFIIAFLVSVKILRARDELYSKEAKLISVIALVALFGYFVDSFFNFPVSRPPMQALYVLIIGVVAANYLTHLHSKKPKYSFFIPGIVVLSILGIGSIYVNYTVYKSYKIQAKIVADLSIINKNPKATPKYRYDELAKQLPDFPNIAEDTEPIGFKLARYLHIEKRPEEALTMLDSTQQFSPYTGYNSYLKSDIYNSQKKPDSAYKYAKKAYLMRPRNLNYYKTATAMAGKVKDTLGIISLFEVHSQYSENSESYYSYFTSLLKAGYELEKLKKVVKKGAELYPDHKALSAINKKLNPEKKHIKIIKKDDKKQKKQKKTIEIIRKNSDKN